MKLDDVDVLLFELMDPPESSILGVVKYKTYKEMRERCADALCTLTNELENKQREIRMYMTKRAEDLELLKRCQTVIANLQLENDMLRNSSRRVGCGADEAENVFDKQFRVETAKSVIRTPLTTESMLNIARESFIKGFKQARS